VSCEAGCASDADVPLPGDGSWTCIRVEDTGIGIAPEQVEAVFEPFVQVDSGHTRTRGGTGLGLTISRQFARLMGGNLTVRSELGKGSCFTLWLPGRLTVGEAGGPASHADPQRSGESPRRSHA
jgi:signal transduction histidine kinase